MTDEDRIEILYRQYGPAIYARCRRLLGSDVLAEDAVQEVFIRVYRNLDRAPDGPTAKLWIYRVATNLCLDQLRARARSRLSENPFPSSGHRSVEDALEDRVLATQLVDHASKRVRAAVWAHYVDGLELSEVARLLGVTRRTVENHLATFLRRARQFMKRAQGE